MGIRVVWVDDNRRRVLRLSFEESWSVDELTGTLEGLLGLLDAAEYPVSLVLDHQEGHVLTATQATEMSFDFEPIFEHALCGPVVIIGAHGRLLGMYEIAASQRTEVYFADTLDDGYNLLRG